MVNIEQIDTTLVAAVNMLNSKGLIIINLKITPLKQFYKNIIYNHCIIIAFNKAILSSIDYISCHQTCDCRCLYTLCIHDFSAFESVHDCNKI